MGVFRGWLCHSRDRKTGETLGRSRSHINLVRGKQPPVSDSRATKDRLENGLRTASKISKGMSECSKAFSRKSHTSFPCNLVILPFKMCLSIYVTYFCDHSV